MILITGATGNIGRPLLRELARAGAKVRALVREGATNVEGAETVAGDLGKPETLPAALDGVETAFLLTPVSQEQVAWKSNLIRGGAGSGSQANRESFGGWGGTGFAFDPGAMAL